MDILRGCDLSNLANGIYDLQDQTSGKIHSFEIFQNEKILIPTVENASHEVTAENVTVSGSELPITCNSGLQPSEENSQERDDSNDSVSTDIMWATDKAKTSTEINIAPPLCAQDVESAANGQQLQELAESCSSTGDDICAAENAFFRSESKQPRSYMICSKCRKYFHVECFNSNPSEFYSCFSCFDYLNLSL